MDATENTRLVKAEIALQCSEDKSSAQQAIHEYFAAQAEMKAETKKATSD